MKFYSVHRTVEAGTSIGYEFFTTKHDAERAAAQWVKEHPEESSVVAVIEVVPTKQGILRALNLHAGHADNG